MSVSWITLCMSKILMWDHFFRDPRIWLRILFPKIKVKTWEGGLHLYSGVLATLPTQLFPAPPHFWSSHFESLGTNNRGDIIIDCWGLILLPNEFYTHKKNDLQVESAFTLNYSEIRVKPTLPNDSPPLFTPFCKPNFFFVCAKLEQEKIFCFIFLFFFIFFLLFFFFQV